MTMEMSIIKVALLAVFLIFLPSCEPLQCYECYTKNAQDSLMPNFGKKITDLCGNYNESLLVTCPEDEVCAFLSGEAGGVPIRVTLHQCYPQDACERVNGSVDSGVVLSCYSCADDKCNADQVIELSENLESKPILRKRENINVADKDDDDDDGDGPLLCYECRVPSHLEFLLPEAWRGTSDNCGSFPFTLVSSCSHYSQVCNTMIAELDGLTSELHACGSTAEACAEVDGDIQSGALITCRSCATDKCNGPTHLP